MGILTLFFFNLFIVDAAYSFTSNFYLDSTQIPENIYNFGLEYRDFSMEGDFYYFLDISGSYYRYATNNSMVKPSLGFTKYRNLSKPGDYSEFGLSLSYSFSQEYPFLYVGPYIGRKVYIRDAVLLKDHLHFNYIWDGDNFYLEVLPGALLTFELSGFTFVLGEEVGLRGLFMRDMQSSSPALGHLGNSGAGNNFYLWNFYFLSNSRTTLRIARNIVDGVGVFYEIAYNLKGPGDLVNESLIAEVNNPLNSEDFSYNGLSHIIGLNMLISKLFLSLNYRLESRKYRSIDTSYVEIFRNDKNSKVTLQGRLPIISSGTELGLTGSFSWTRNSSTFEKFTYSEKFYSFGLYFNF